MYLWVHKLAKYSENINKIKTLRAAAVRDKLRPIKKPRAFRSFFNSTRDGDTKISAIGLDT